MTFIKFFADDTIKLEIYHDCGWFMTAAATVSTVFQMINSEKKGVFLNGVFLDPIQYVNDLRRLGVQINICQRGST